MAALPVSRLGWSAVAMALLAAGLARSTDPPAAPKVVRAETNPWAEATRDVLNTSCGRCHRSDVPTAPQRALVVFDLTREIWYGAMTKGQLDEMLRRVRATKDVPEIEKDAVAKFVACANTGACTLDAPPPRAW